MTHLSRTKGMQSPARRAWYLYRRQLRITRREISKMYIDVMIYGSGFVHFTTEPDYIRHVPAQDVILEHSSDGQT